MARRLIETESVKFGWRILLLPSFLLDYSRFKKNCFLTRKNLLYTKQLAFDAAKKIFQGQARASEMASIEFKTKNLLDKDKKGLYTEKIRRKQLQEIELLIDHYLSLFNSDKADYDGMIKTVYPSKQKYMTFFNTLQRAEQEVIQAAIATVRKGSKKDRIQWFKKVENVSRKHALITFRRNEYWLEDLDITNGTYINGIKIAKCVLRNNDQIDIGGVKMYFNEITVLKEE